MNDKIEFLELRFPDLLGRMKAMTVPCKPVETVGELLKDPAMKNGMSCDGSSVTGLAKVESSDLRLEPDPSSLIELPYSVHRTAAVMCYIRERIIDGNSTGYFCLDSRGRLKEVSKNLLLGEMHLKVKVEPEFHFITPDGEPFDNAGYADTYPTSPGMHMLLELASTLVALGIEPRVIHHEVGESQQEIELDFDEATKMAEPIGKGEFIVSPLGERLLGNGGYDPYLEDIQTLWLIHWNLSTRIKDPIFAWDFLINRWHEPEIFPSLAMKAFEKEAALQKRKLS